MTLVIPVIMCGGAGTRLWPASRHSRPKQFLPLLGDRSLFQEAALRVCEESLFQAPICITNADYRFVVAEQLREIGVEGEIVLEPARRDSAPAFGAACALARQRGEDAVVLALPADHGIRDTDGFRATVRRGLDAAQAGHIVTFGARPDGPATGYGYIAVSKTHVAGEEVFGVERFVEKPDRDTALEYVERGYLWNTGNFLCRAATLLEELESLAPEVRKGVDASVAGARRDLDFVRLDPEAFERTPAISIDYAVMEKTECAAVAEASFDWSDIGSWEALWGHSEKDAAGNVARGDVRIIGGTQNFVQSDQALTTLVGVDGLVVVATRDAVMVAARHRVEEVREMVKVLEAEDRPEVSTHAKVFRPWGSYESVDHGKRYQVKRITVVPGGKLSLQKHRHRAEHWVVVHGIAKVTIDDFTKTLHDNESAYIPLGAVHRLENPGDEPLDLIEVQSGDYLGEDDIIRLEDVYGRDAPGE
jgi:mannose-1-phosphate guanylyltransferase/mannose-6-phosphate isomerase